MWEEAIKVAATGFTVVLAGLVMLAFGVKIMSFCCRLFTRAGKQVKG